MPPPTLLVKGSLVSNVIDEQSSLDNIVPIDHIMNWIRIRQSMSPSIKNRVLVLKSDTGSGKSTAFPATLFKTFFKLGAGSIACAQPRVLNAVSIVRDLTSGTHYPFFKLGENIGWQTGPTKRAPVVGLTYMTIGVLTMQLKTLSDDAFMNKYRFIIIDEVHESSLDQARVLYMLKGFMIRNASHTRLPFVVLTSATFDTTKFLKYFDINDMMRTNLIQVTGFTHKLTENWLFTKPIAGVIAECARVVERIHTEGVDDLEQSADILIFAPGAAEIEAIRSRLEIVNKKLAAGGKPVLMILVVVSETVSENKPDYAAVFAPVASLRVNIGGKYLQPRRRVIISTNVAETGVTIETLRYVIDLGFNRTPEYNPITCTNAIITKCATQSMIRQRMGRANRKAPGVFYPLYTKKLFDKLDVTNPPAVETVDTLNIALDILYTAVSSGFTEAEMKGTRLEDNFPCIDIATINDRMLDPIPHDSLTGALETLFSIGFISPRSNYRYQTLANTNVLDKCKLIGEQSAPPRFSITKLGALACAMGLRINCQSARVILASYQYDISTIETVSIVAALQFEASEFVAESTKPIDFNAIWFESLPKYLTEGMGGNTDTDIAIIFRMRMLIADDFIFGMLLFRCLHNLIEISDPALTLEIITQWCERVGVKAKTVMSFLAMRDEIIEGLIAGGFNVFVGTSMFDVPEELFIEHIVRIKYALYDGYKDNIAVFNDKLQTYKTRRGVVVKMPTMFAQTEIKKAEMKKINLDLGVKPRFILYDTCRLVQDRKTHQYNAVVGRVSTLDSYVCVDTGMI